MEHYEKKGYLSSDFRLFHLTDRSIPNIKYHYHEFDKITILIKGNVHYTIEGRTYQLEPYDMVLVRHNEIHRPIVDTTTPYERIIIYISPTFIENYRTQDYDLGYCFQKAAKRNPVCFGFPLVKKVFCFRQSKDWKNPFPLMAMPTNSTGKFFF